MDNLLAPRSSSVVGPKDPSNPNNGNNNNPPQPFGADFNPHTNPFDCDNGRSRRFLQANDKDKTLWTLQSVSSNVKLADFENMKVEVKGNLTPTPNLIEVSEVITFDIKPSTQLIPMAL